MPQSAILLLAKGVKGASCVKLINDALESQDFFEFTELLTIPNIKELQDTPNFGNAFNQLVAFARSTFRDYPTNLPPLTARQKQKLRILTIARLAQKHCSLPFATLLEELQLNSTQELEDLLITAINSRVIEGQINQKQSTVAIDRFMPIDRADAEVALRKLDEWISHSKDVQIRLNWS